jgi:hypothetical protein
MDLGIQFPDEKQLMAEETARFRTLPPEEQIEQLVDCLRLYHSFREMSRGNSFIERMEQEYEAAGTKAVFDMVAKYGG